MLDVMPCSPLPFFSGYLTLGFAVQHPKHANGFLLVIILKKMNRMNIFKK